MMIGSPLWAVTLGRYNVQYATIPLEKYNTAPREGNYKAAKRVIGYLKHYEKQQTVIDPTDFVPPPEAEPSIEHLSWLNQYPEASEQLPDNMPEPLMKPIQMSFFFDSSHGASKVNQRSHVGIIGFRQSTPYFTYSKELKTIKTSSYGSETTSGRLATEQIISDQYCLQMLGVLIESAAIMYGDNQSSQISCSLPSSQLIKKHNAILYHKGWEAAATGIVLYAWIFTFYDLADVLIKALGGKSFCSLIWFYMFGKGPQYVKRSIKNMVNSKEKGAEYIGNSEHSLVEHTMQEHDYMIG